MIKRPDEPIWALFLRVGQTLGGSMQISAEMLDLSPAREPEFRHFSAFDETTWYDGLQITAYVDREHDAPWGWDHGYAGIPYVGLRRAEAMTKVLRRIDRGQQRDREQSGYPESYLEYLHQLARVLRVDRYAWHATSWRAGMGERWWETGDASSARIWLDDVTKRYCRQPAEASR